MCFAYLIGDSWARRTDSAAPWMARLIEIVIPSWCGPALPPWKISLITCQSRPHQSGSCAGWWGCHVRCDGSGRPPFPRRRVPTALGADPGRRIPSVRHEASARRFGASRRNPFSPTAPAAREMARRRAPHRVFRAAASGSGLLNRLGRQAAVSLARFPLAIVGMPETPPAICLKHVGSLRT